MRRCAPLAGDALADLAHYAMTRTAAAPSGSRRTRRVTPLAPEEVYFGEPHGRGILELACRRARLRAGVTTPSAKAEGFSQVRPADSVAPESECSLPHCGLHPGTSRSSGNRMYVPRGA